MREQQVVKANSLIEASYRLTLGETRIILSAIAQVRRDETPTDEIMYEVRADALADVSGLAATDAYKHLRDAAKRLKKREITIHQSPKGTKQPRVTETCWVQTVEYIPKEGRVLLRFSKDILPYLSQLQEQFTRYELSNVAGMRSVHGVRLYELLQQWRQEGSREIEIEEVRRLFGVQGQYPTLKDLKRRVIEPAVADVNEHSDLTVAWGQRKAGRRVVALQFSFEPKTDQPQERRGKPGEKRIQGYPVSVLEAEAKPGESWEGVAQRLKKES